MGGGAFEPLSVWPGKAGVLSLGVWIGAFGPPLCAFERPGGRENSSQLDPPPGHGSSPDKDSRDQLLPDFLRRFRSISDARGYGPHPFFRPRGSTDFAAAKPARSVRQEILQRRPQRVWRGAKNPKPYP